jgi:hypothetical protein
MRAVGFDPFVTFSLQQAVFQVLLMWWFTSGAVALSHAAIKEPNDDDAVDRQPEV